jgi:hypothetical protein
MADDAFDIVKLPEALTPPQPDLRRRLELFVQTMRDRTQSPLFRSPSISLECRPRGDGTFDVVCVSPVDDLGMRGLLTYSARSGRTVSQRGSAGSGATSGGTWRAVGRRRRPSSSGGSTTSAARTRRRAGPFRSHRARGGVGNASVLRDEAVRAERIVDDWVSGEVFHDDQDTRRRIDWAGDRDAYLFGLLTAVQELTKVDVLFRQDGEGHPRGAEARRRLESETRRWVVP